MFRISWRYLETGIIGHGSYVFHTYEDAMNIAAHYNRRYPNMLHYVERQPGPVGAGAS
jgi:hypothetical protein